MLQDLPSALPYHLRMQQLQLRVHYSSFSYRNMFVDYTCLLKLCTEYVVLHAVLDDDDLAVLDEFVSTLNERILDVGRHVVATYHLESLAYAVRLCGERIGVLCCQTHLALL